MWYTACVSIQSFAGKVTEDFYITGKVPKGAGFGNVSKVALRKLDMLNAAAVLEDLKSPPGNRLEALKGDLKGFYSIRVNDQWRIVFTWTELDPSEVEITDYH